MADPIPNPVPNPTPDSPPARFSRAWGWAQLMLLLPTNWRQIVQWLVLFGVISGINYLRGPKLPPIPVPDPPLPVFDLVLPQTVELDDAGIQELDRRKVKVRRTGWRAPTPEETTGTLKVLQSPHFRDTDAGQAVAADVDAPVWRLAIKGRGKAIPTRDQGQLGSCVSFGFSGAIEYTMASQAALGKQRQELPDSCQEAVYGGSRVEANGGKLPPDMRGQDGSVGAWAAKWLEQVGGVLPRGKYGATDLTAYDVRRCKQWGDAGVPKELEAECRKHKTHCSMVTSTEMARTALSQGYAIAVCSNQGFAMTRDAEGFARAQGNWGHCMCIIGYRADRPGFLILNSWGPNWISGPKGKFDDIPDGSFWAEASVVERMLKGQDSFAVSNAEGFKKRKLNADDWIVRNPKQGNLQVNPQGGFEPLFALAP